VNAKIRNRKVMSQTDNMINELRNTSVFLGGGFWRGGKDDLLFFSKIWTQ